MKKTLTFIFSILLFTCSKEDTTNSITNNTTLEGGIIYTAQIVEVKTNTATLETYQGKLGNNSIELRKTTKNSLVFFVEPNFDLGNKTLIIEGLNNLKINYTIKKTILTQTVKETIQPYFDQLVIERQAITPENNGDKAILLIDGFNNLYASLNDQQKEDISIFYKANKGLIDATVTGDINKFNSDVVTQFTRCKSSIYLTGILGVFTTISTSLPFTQIATPILAVSTGVLLAKTYEHCSSLATETIKNVFVKAEDLIFNSKVSNSAISLSTNTVRNIPIQLQSRTMLPEDQDDTNIIISTYFESTSSFNQLVIQKMNVAINYLNTEWSFFFDIDPYEEVTVNDTATTQITNITADDFDNFTFSVSNSNLNLESLEYSNGGINLAVRVIDENNVTNNLEIGTLDFTYQDDFNSFSGNFDIEVRAGFDIFTDAAAFKSILEENGISVTDPRWNSNVESEVISILEEKGCTIFNNRIDTINLISNNLTLLPDTIEDITNLKVLQLSSNQLSSIPSSIGNLSNLTDLNLNNNILSSLPTEIGNLSNLRSLGINNCLFTSLPNSIFNITGLTYLGAESNQINSLSSSIGNLTNLEELQLGLNNLTNLPSSIGNLTNLTTIALISNQLTSIPSSISNLDDLIFLNLYENNLETIPSSIGNMTNLVQLNIWDNQLTSIPSSIGNLTNLVQFNVNNNPDLNCLPQQVWDLTNSGTNISRFDTAIDGNNDIDCTQ